MAIWVNDRVGNKVDEKVDDRSRASEKAACRVGDLQAVETQSTTFIVADHRFLEDRSSIWWTSSKNDLKFNNPFNDLKLNRDFQKVIVKTEN